jgi:hypothetical protein
MVRSMNKNIRCPDGNSQNATVVIQKIYRMNKASTATVDDNNLADCDKDTIEQIAANLRRHTGGEDTGSPPECRARSHDTDTTIRILIFGAKKSQQQRLIILSQPSLCDTSTKWSEDQSLSENLQEWTGVMKNFSQQWKALETKKSQVRNRRIVCFRCQEEGHRKDRSASSPLPFSTRVLCTTHQGGEI